MSDVTTTYDARGCPSADELAAYVANTASAAQRARIEDHTRHCAKCRAATGSPVIGEARGGAWVGRYRLDEKLGSGGMGVVWRAWDPALEREIALKLLHPELHDEHGRGRAIREARALARLQHPNVVAVYDVGEHDGDVFIATELVDGETLDRWQKDKPADKIVAAYAQAARGLAAAHELGLVHRDVKPSNIFMGRDGRVRVGDFGLATTAAPSSLNRTPGRNSGHMPLPKLTRDGAQLGTPAYMAPEQRASADVDARADQYSLCLALAEALLGKRPPVGSTAASLEASGVDAPWAAIMRGLEITPRDRFPGMAQLEAALERPAVGRSRLRWVAAGAVALIVGGVVVVKLARTSAVDPEPVRAPADAAPIVRVATVPLDASAPVALEGAYAHIGGGARFLVPPKLTYLDADHAFHAADGTSIAFVVTVRPGAIDLDSLANEVAAKSGLVVDRIARRASTQLVAEAHAEAAPIHRALLVATRPGLQVVAVIAIPDTRVGSAELAHEETEILERRLELERPRGTPLEIEHGASFIAPAGYGYTHEDGGLVLWGPAGGVFIAVQTWDGYTAANLPKLVRAFEKQNSRDEKSFAIIGDGEVLVTYRPSKPDGLVETMYTASGKSSVVTLMLMVDKAKVNDPELARLSRELTARVVFP